MFFLLLLNSCRAKKQTQASRERATKNAGIPGSGKELVFGELYFRGCNERMKGNLQQALKAFEECLQIFPGNAATCYELGTVNKLLGNNEQALVYAKICAEANQDNEWYQLLLIECYNSVRQYKQAIKTREALVKKFPNKNEFKEDLAIEYALVGQYDRSFKIYDELEKNYGFSEQISLNKVKLLKTLHKSREAEKELIKLLQNNPNELRNYSHLAEFYLEQNEGEKAKAIYDKMLQIDPLNPTVNLAMYDYYNSKGRSEEAFIYLKKSFENPGLDMITKASILSEYYRNAEQGNTKAKTKGTELAKVMVAVHPGAVESNGIYADFLKLNNKIEEAAKYYYLAATGEKPNFKALKSLLYLDNGLMRYDSLERHSAVCIDVFPTQAEGYLFNGLANSMLKNHTKAVQVLKDGLGFVTNNNAYQLDFYKILGDAYFHLKDYPQSDKVFNEALKIDPDNSYVLNNYAYYLSLRNENLDKAEKYASRINELKPGNPSYMDTYGWILYMQKKYTEAESWLLKAVSGSPSDPVILEHYGDVLFRLNKLQEALEQWQSAKNAGGSSVNLLKKLKERRIIE